MRLVYSRSWPYSSLTCRLALFRSRLAQLYATTLQDEEQWFLTDLVEAINKGLAVDALFSTAEATAICQRMNDDEELMLAEGIVYKM